MPPRGTVPIVVRIAAVALGVVAVVATLRTWTVGVGTDFRPTSHPMWSSGAVAATGAVLLALGALLAAAGALTAGRVTRVVSGVAVTGGAVVAVAGAVVVLVDRYSAPASIAPVTVAIANFSVGPNLMSGPRAANPAWVVVVAAGALALAVVVLRTWSRRSGPPPRSAVTGVGAAALLGLLTLVVGASVLPWRIGNQLRGEPLWQSGGVVVSGAALVVLAALSVLVSGLPQSVPRASAVAPVALLASAVGLGLLVSGRLPYFRSGFVAYGWYAYSPTTELPRPPGAPALHSATWVVLGGAALVTIAAALATVLAAPPAPAVADGIDAPPVPVA